MILHSGCWKQPSEAHPPRPHGHTPKPTGRARTVTPQSPRAAPARSHPKAHGPRPVGYRAPWDTGATNSRRVEERFTPRRRSAADDESTATVESRPRTALPAQPTSRKGIPVALLRVSNPFSPRSSPTGKDHHERWPLPVRGGTPQPVCCACANPHRSSRAVCAPGHTEIATFLFPQSAIFRKTRVPRCL